MITKQKLDQKERAIQEAIKQARKTLQYKLYNEKLGTISGLRQDYIKRVLTTFEKTLRRKLANQDQPETQAFQLIMANCLTEMSGFIRGIYNLHKVQEFPVKYTWERRVR